MEVFGRIYLVRNRHNGKSYIGQTTEALPKRWSRHLWKAAHGSQFRFHRAIRKHGVESFDVVMLHQAFSRAELNEMERCSILGFQSTDPDYGYNMTPGGDSCGSGADHPRFGKRHSEETRRKISEVKRAQCRKHTPEWKAAQSERLKGRVFSDEHRARLSASQKGVSETEETRRKMSISRKGRKRNKSVLPKQLRYAT